MSMTGRSVILQRWCLVLLLLIVPQSAAGSWYDSYDQAKKALSEERWSEAIGHLNDAIAQKPESDHWARMYGMNYVEYFPYLKLGIAYFHMGRFEAALDALETEERNGEIVHSQEALAELRQYRERASQALDEAVAGRQQRAQQVVEQSVAEAVELEAQGRLDEALDAFERVLAVAPDNQQAIAAKQRLQLALAEQQRLRDRQERFDRLLARGRAELSSGRYRSAAATFDQAQELAAGDQTWLALVRPLLAQAQEGIRAELAQQDDAEQQGLLALSLARAAEHEAAGELEKALNELQSVLALDPENAGARALQQRLVQARRAATDAADRADSLSRLLAAAEERLAAGDYAMALRNANRVLAIDPDNPKVRDCLKRAYAGFNRALLDDTLPPTIELVWDQHEGIAVVHAPQLTLTGTVYDSTPVKLSFFDGEQQLDGQADIDQQELQGLWITKLSLNHHLATGISTITVTATDSGGRSASAKVSVEYVVPFVRTLWFPVTIAGALGAVVAAFLVWRRQRRQGLLRRRFNPYVAGPPILQQQRFFGRQQLLDYVLRRIHNNSILLYGERRIGKTSFQHQLKRCLADLDDPEHQFYPVYIDLQGTPEERFFATMAADIYQELAPVLDGLEPQRSFPEEEEGYSYREFVKEIHQILKVLKSRSSKKAKLVLLIDEVDELNDYDPRINQKLRSLFMRTFAENLVSVVSGVAIKKHWDREGSPWYNFFQEIEVRPLDAREAQALITAPVRGVFRFDTGVIEEILRCTGCKPYLVQRLCSGIVDRLHEDRRSSATIADVKAVAQHEGF